MKYAMFSPGFDPAPRLGLLRGDALVDLKTAPALSWPDAPTTLVDLIHRGPDAWRRMAEIGAEASGAHSHASVHGALACADPAPGEERVLPWPATTPRTRRRARRPEVAR